MAGTGKRDRHTSAVDNVADAKRAQRNKRSRSASASQDEVVEQVQSVSSSKAAKSKARRPPQTTTSRTGKTTSVTPEDHEAIHSSIPLASGSASKPSNSLQNTSVKNAKQVLRIVPGGQERGLMQELTDIQARLAEAQDNYQALREAYQTLQELRETGPEGTLREVEEQTVRRLEALRKQVATYAKENEELRNQADDLKEEIATLSERQQEKENGGDSDLRTRTVRNEDDTEAMEATPERKREQTQSGNSSGAGSSLSKQAATSLRKENEDLNSQVLELREELTALTEETLQLKKEKKTLKKHWEEEREKLESSLKQGWEKERQKLLAENEQVSSRSKQLEKELAFEIEQSKKLQALASQNTASQSKTAANLPLAATTKPSPGNSGELVQLLLDFTGMTLVRRPQEGDKTYNFVMTDFKKRKALNFKLIVDHEAGSVDFIPDLLPGRDDEVIDSMEVAIRGHIKFEYDLIQTFFKRLWRALNGHK